MSADQDLRLKLASACHVPADCFLRAARATLELAEEMDQAEAGTAGDRVQWEIVGLELGSAVMVLGGPRDQLLAERAARAAARAARGADYLRRKGRRPEGFTDRALRYLQAIAAVTGHGVEHAELSCGETVAIITRSMSAQVDLLLQEKPRPLQGYVEGKIGTVTTHGESYFAIWEPLHNRRIECHFDEDRHLATVARALAEKRRVGVLGVITYDDAGLPERVVATEVRLLRAEAEIPTTEEIYGMDPDFTGELDSVTYVRRMRDEW